MMKNYVSLLNDEQLLRVCRLITARKFREYFRKNPIPFNRIKGGYNILKASDEDTISFVCRHINNDFITTYINNYCQSELDETIRRKQQLIASGKNASEAILDALEDSVFSGQIGLFFVLLEADCSEDKISMVQYALELRAKIRQQTSSALELQTKAEESEAEAKRKNSEGEERFRSLQEKYDRLESDSSELSKANKSLADQLELASEEQAALKVQLSEARKELKGYQDRAEYAVMENRFQPMRYQYMSLCQPYKDDYEQKRLLRLADITTDGEISVRFLENIPKKCHLYQTDGGPAQPVHYGIWDWEIKPDSKYFRTSYNTNYSPIEVVIASDCSSVSDLIARLRSGVEYPYIPERMLYSFDNGFGYEGLLCRSASLQSDSGVIFLRDNVIALGEFEFTENDLIRFDDVVFLRHLNTGLPKRVETVRNVLETVRDILLSRIHWTDYKYKGFLKNDCRLFKDFIGELPLEDIISEISSKCDCNIEDAKKHLEALVPHADETLVGHLPEIEILAQVVRNNDSLFKACQNALRQEWEDANREQMDKVRKSLEALQADGVELQRNLERRQKECSTLEARSQAIQEQIEQRKQFAKDVEAEVNAKITQARENAARFVAENAFMNAPSTIREQETISHAVRACFEEGTYRDADILTVSHSWKELLDIIQDELGQAGVTGTDQRMGLSGVLYAAFLSRMPILLAGPNGQEIATAFSLAIHGCTPSMLRCDGDYQHEDLQRCQNADTDVVVIENPFEHGWYNSILKLISLREHFYVLVCPFAEELAIEPKGLLNYCIPLVTESFVASSPRMEYLGGRMADVFSGVPESKKSLYAKELRRLELNPYAESNVKQILSYLYSMVPEVPEKAAYNFVLKSIAYALGISEKLEEERSGQAESLTVTTR